MVEDGLVRPAECDFRAAPGVGLQDALDLVLEEGEHSLVMQ